MAGSDDRGLDLRLPWGRPSAPGAKRPARPTGASADLPTVPVAPPVPPPAPPAREPIQIPEPPPGIDDAGAVRIAEALEGLHFGITARANRLEEQVAADIAGLGARFEKLEGRLEAAHAASVEAVGLLAGQLLAGLEQQIASVKVGLQARQEQMVAHIEEQVAWIVRAQRAGTEQLVSQVEEQVLRIEGALRSAQMQVVTQVDAAASVRHEDLLTTLSAGQAATMEAVGGLASGQLVDKLLEDVVATGEVLDAELIDLKRMLHDQRVAPDAQFAPDEAAVSELSDWREPAPSSSSERAGQASPAGPYDAEVEPEPRT